ncbi:ABC transporter permease [Evansella halocellulosilytica]|uniref:ABC transporter permease n=1 Tax=Evansella halocellulosilytica TaxID=2011013 RepID=UPI000BB843D1|nr:ABC transporter permease [Evansella halocellulosilytica]
MNKVLAAEFYKLKHSKILFTVWIGAFLPALLYTIANLFSEDRLIWDLWFGDQFSVLLIFSPPLFAIITGFIVGSEYQHKTINSLFTYPYSRFHFLAGKMIVAVTFIFMTCILAFAANIVTGLIFVEASLSLEDTVTYLIAYLVIALMITSVVPLWMFVSILGKSYTPAIVISLVISTLPGPIGGSTAYGEIVQFVLRIAGRGEPIDLFPVIVIFGSLFLVFLIIASTIYVKSDVHSGS